MRGLIAAECDNAKHLLASVGAAEGCEAFTLTHRHRSLLQLLQVIWLLRDSAVSGAQGDLLQLKPALYFTPLSTIRLSPLSLAPPDSYNRPLSSLPRPLRP
jgi:hypothetical protein